MKPAAINFLSTALCIVLLWPASMLAQSVNTESTPEVLFPEFYIAAVGEFPEGYFHDVVIAPGETVELTVAVVNSGKIPVDLRVVNMNALSRVNGGFRADDPANDPVGATAWIDFPDLEVSLEVGKTWLQDFTITVPEGTPPGQYMSGLQVLTADTVEIPGTDILDQIIAYNISIAVLVPGEFEVSFELGSPVVSSPDRGRGITVPVVNTGGYLVKPSGEVKLIDETGRSVLESPIIMGSVYTGVTTSLQIPIAEQMLPGNYKLELTLMDSDSGAMATIKDEAVVIPPATDPTGVSITSVSIKPNADDIAFANVEISLNNGGSQLPATNVVLQVYHNGELVDAFPLATNQVMLSGENVFSTRYIPAEMWSSGTYTFGIIVKSVSPNGGQEVEILNELVNAEIIVP